MEQEVCAEGEWRKSCQTTHNVFFNITVKKIQNYPFHRQEFFPRLGLRKTRGDKGNSKYILSTRNTRTQSQMSLNT